MAGVILMLAALFGILFFIPALTLSRLSDQENKDKRPVYILGATGSVLFFAGMLFKIQHWPLSTMFVITGIFLLFVLAFPMFTWLTWKNENHTSSMFIYLVIGSILIIVPGTMLNLNLQRSYQDYYYPNNYQQNALYDYLYRNNSSIVVSYHDSLTYTKMEQLHSKTTGMLEIINNIQKKMVQESEGQPVKSELSAGQINQTKTSQDIVYYELLRPFDTGTAKNFLMSDCSARKELNSSLAEYVGYLTGIIPAEDLLKYKKILDTETFLSVGNTPNAEMSLTSGLHSLEIMKNGVLTVESCVLNKMTRQ